MTDRIKVPSEDENALAWAIANPGDFRRAIQVLNLLRGVEAQLCTPGATNRGRGKTVLVEGDTNVILPIPLVFPTPLSDVSGGATLAAMIAAHNSLLTQLRLTGQNPS